MKTRKSFLMVAVLAGIFTCFSTTSAMAQLYFSSMQGTWWKATKMMDKGYIFTMPPADGTNGKAIKWKHKTKLGYIYFPDNSLNGFVFDGVTVVTSEDVSGFHVARDIQLSVQGGTPYDFVVALERSEENSSELFVFQAKLIEDKKIPGQIKSGQINSMSGSFYDPEGDSLMIVGNREFKFKFITEDQVPDQIRDIVLGD